MRTLSLRTQNALQQEREFEIYVSTGKQLEPHQRHKCAFDFYVDNITEDEK